MEDNLARQIVVQIRRGPATNRPISPPQPPWQGSPPPAVKKVLTRDALDRYRDWYANWATNFALLSDEFIERVVGGEWHRIKEQLKPGKWDSFPFLPEYYCKVGNDYLWVQEFDGGCTIELCYPDVDPDVRILTIENMPVMCPSALWAARLSWACYPNPPAKLVWHSYW